jgi:dTDP-4-amino-4,6-dideoxygalactose transaminase
MVGAIPIFVDIEPDTCNISPEAIRQAITSKTKAIIPVHFAGLPANMDQILAIAREYGLSVIEDCAHAHGAAYHHQMVGSFGIFGMFSFQGSKNMTAGEGGIVVTNDREKAELAQSFVWGGRFPDSGWYGHANLASNLRMTELQAAVLSAQLTRLPQWFATRYRNGLLLDSMLDSIQGVKPMAAPDHGTTHAYHLYLFRYDSSKFNGVSKTAFVKALQAEGIPASAGYDYPLYQNRVFLEKRFWPGGYPFIQGVYDQAIDYAQFKHTCPVAERACSSEVVWLPQYTLLADTGAMEDVAVAIDKIRLHSADLL